VEIKDEITGDETIETYLTKCKTRQNCKIETNEPFNMNTLLYFISQFFYSISLFFVLNSPVFLLVNVCVFSF